MKASVLIFTTSMCFLSGNVLADTFYLDPVNGSLSGDGSIENPFPSLQEVLENDLVSTNKYKLPYNWNGNNELILKNENAPIKAGDTLVLKTGNHGDLKMYNMVNAETIYIKAASGEEPIVGSLSMIGGKNWSFDGIEFNYDYSSRSKLRGGYIVFFEKHSWQGPVKNITIKNSVVKTTDSTEYWGKQDWLDNVVDGIRSEATNFVADGNILKNIGFGISAEGENSVVTDNSIYNFSGDALRGLGDNSNFEYNFVANGFKIDGNHDDGFQSWAGRSGQIENLVISHNTFISDYNHPNPGLKSEFQGIGLFDGFFNNFRIENNLVITNTYNAITLLGSNNSIVANNTIIDPIEDNKRPWIKINHHKNGTFGTGNKVVNNISKVIEANQGVFYSSNYQVDFEDYYTYFKDPDTFNYELNPNSSLVDAGYSDQSLNLSPNDIRGARRDSNFDVGSYELIQEEQDPQPVICSIQ